MAEGVAGGPGWVIGADLRPAITDVDAFRRGMRDDSLAGPIELLWSGDPAGALAALDRLAPTLRIRALRADCYRDLGDFPRAVGEYDALVAECAGTSREAVMRQHRDKALLFAGELNRAIEDFQRVLDLREDDDPTLLASAQQALAVARRTLAARGSTA